MRLLTNPSVNSAVIIKTVYEFSESEQTTDVSSKIHRLVTFSAKKCCVRAVLNKWSDIINTVRTQKVTGVIFK